MRLFRKAKGEDAPVFEGGCSLLTQFLVWAHPDRTETENGNLPGVPVLQAVEAQDLGELTIAPGIPTRVGCALAFGRAHGCKDPFFANEVEKIGVPRAVVVVLE